MDYYFLSTSEFLLVKRMFFNHLFNQRQYCCKLLLCKKEYGGNIDDEKHTICLR